MQTLQTEVLVIGGGATGTGVLRDLAMRGFDAILVERRDYSHGTTGRYHGLLHSGGRYAVKDPQAALECITENRILRRIMPQCIEDTGGFFVLTPWDEPEYASRFLEGCLEAGIPVEEIPTHQMLREEPLLNPNISRCFRVPDAAADSFLASELNVASAREHGAQAFTYHEVLELIRQDDRVVGVLCHDLVKDKEIQIFSDLVINASGAWAGKITGTIGVQVQIRPGKGTMVAINHRVLNTVVNRCKMPADGDIIVPIHTVAVIGTTDVQVTEPDHFAIEPWEIRLMLEEGEKLIPGLKGFRMLRAWAGVRPLYEEEQTSGSRDISRAFVLLDHEARDGIAGLVTITSGKWTTYRMMAEATVDLACQKLNTQRPCRTHLEPLPDREFNGYHHLGARLAEIEAQETYGDLICECELATYADVAEAIVQGGAQTLDDIRRDVRMGMGPCQGGFCTYRTVGMLHDLRRPPIHEINMALRDFLLERWKGLLPVLWGGQLRQERLNELIYLSLMNADHLPGPRASRLGPQLYARPTGGNGRSRKTPVAPKHVEEIPSRSFRTSAPAAAFPDILVIGGGLAGLVAAWRASLKGKRVRLITKGWGATHWHAGCVDVIGYYAASSPQPVESPRATLEDMIRENPRHPYGLAGLEAIEEATLEFQLLCDQAGYPLRGSLESNWILPSAIGAPRPTCLAPATMIAGDLHRHDPMLIAGFETLKDFYPGLIAGNLALQGISASAVMLDLASLKSRRFLYPHILAQRFEEEEFREEVAKTLKPGLGNAQRVGFPAVLGLDDAVTVKNDLEKKLGREVFEIPPLPPSIPGIRLHNILLKIIEKNGGRVFDGMEALAAEVEGKQVVAVFTEAAARNKVNRASNFILATGGILGGGIFAGHTGEVSEVVFNLPLSAPEKQDQWLDREFLGLPGHPIYRSGLNVDSSFRPIMEGDDILFENLFAAGTTLAGGDYIRERSFDGIALVTGFLVGEAVANS
jgi:glycerol-3-phosphate dehydrogenase